ncbi:hypothetical protein GCM10027079_14460 [Sediminivirga luteola]|uniref:Uncharacterized protein n=1 Tax=Sediminivirga luteola TaxID=1774748 RepID=A0A8J2XIV0_9MICO|nr:hypothetical protein GCM10011333_01910 [Sediminivirga luteola]
MSAPGIGGAIRSILTDPTTRRRAAEERPAQINRAAPAQPSQASSVVGQTCPAGRLLDVPEMVSR